MDSLRTCLARHGLDKYTDLFIEHGIDLDVLADLTDADLEKLGIPMGDRRRFLKAAPTMTTGISSPQQATVRGRAERRQLTVMFADIVGSTALAARLDPEDMKDLIACFQKAVGDEVARFGGYVAKPLGDGLLIYFGWPQAHEDDAERAVRAGLAAIAAVGRLTATDQPLAARVGIATGEVVVGDFVGDGVDEANAVVGETPNLAARLQTVAAANQVIVSETTARLIGRQFAFTNLGGQTLKGFDRPVSAFRIDGEDNSGSRFEALRGGRVGRFVGREREVDFIVERLEEARASGCQVVLISGEAGIGKSRLVSELLARPESKSFHHINYQGSPLHANTALYPVLRRLELIAGILPEQSATERAEKLAAIIPCDTQRQRDAFTYIAELMSLFTMKGSGEARTSADVQREAALDVLVEIVVAIANSSPILVTLEDAHWIDATTQDFLERLVIQLQSFSALVLITYRPSYSPPWAQHVNVGLLALNRLGRRNCEAMVNALLADAPELPREIAEEIIAKADGNPLFIEELAGSAVESIRAKTSGTIQIPATLRDSLSERLDRLGAAREVAQVAAVVGREFRLDLVAAVLKKPINAVVDDVARLTEIGAVFPISKADLRYAFKHALLRDAAYESMLKSDRREIHGRIAEILQAEQPNLAETDPEVLAIHLSGAGDTDGAAQCWRKLGHLALRNSAYREAIGAFKNALSLLAEGRDSADTHRAIASAYFAIGNHISVSEHLSHAAADAEAAGDLVMMAEIAMQQCHDLVHYGGSLNDSFKFGERALEIATTLNDDSLAYGARFSLAQAAWLSGDFKAGINFAAANLPENLSDPARVRDFGTAGSLMMDSMAILGACHAYIGDFDRAFAAIDRAVEVSTDAAFDISVVQYHLNRAHLHRGDAATVLPLAQKSVTHATTAGLKFTLPWHLGVLGYALALSGNIDEAVEVLEEASRESDATHQLPANIRAHAFLAETLLLVDAQRALEVAETGLVLARKYAYRAQEVELLRAKSGALAERNPIEAEANARQGLAVALELGMKPEEGHAYRVIGNIAMANGNAAAAAENHARACALYEHLGITYWLERMG